MLLIRHGQSEFNVHYGKTRQDPGIRDPRLTPEGRSQAAAAVARLGDFPVRRIVASPYRRTLETASIVAESLSVPISVTPVVAERAVFVCDIGSPASELRHDFPDIDFAELTAENWWQPSGEDLESLDRRCRDFRLKCREGALTDTLVITHWGFIRGLTSIRAQNCGIVRFDPDGPHPGGGTVVWDCDPC